MFSCPFDVMHHNTDTQVNSQNSEPATSNEGDFTSGCDKVQWDSASGIKVLQDKAVLKVKGSEEKLRQGMTGRAISVVIHSSLCKYYVLLN